MKILILLLCFQLGRSQCMEDIARYATYNHMDVFNHSTQKYEKYNKVKETRATVIIEPDKKMISFIDSLNNYNKQYFIIDCQIGKTELVYKCIDISNKKHCEFIFSEDKSLTVMYEPEPVIYKVTNK